MITGDQFLTLTAAHAGSARLGVKVSLPGEISAPTKQPKLKPRPDILNRRFVFIRRVPATKYTASAEWQTSAQGMPVPRIMRCYEMRGSV